MEKFSILLDETTIINFKLVWKLIGRYRSHLTFSLVGFLVLFSYFYYSQPVIYTTSIPLKTVAKHTVSNDLSALLPVENTSSITLNELNVSLTSYTFLKTFAELIYEDVHFKDLKIGSIANGKLFLGAEISKKCSKNRDCIVEKIANLIQGTYGIEQGPTETRFVITVNALDSETVYYLSKVIVNAVEQSRIKSRQYLVLKEMDSVANLIKESRSILQKMDGMNLLEDNEREGLVVGDLKERIRILQVSINNEIANMSSLEARVSENKRTIEGTTSSEKLVHLKQISINKKINEVRQNIASLSSIPEINRSDLDKKILKTLKEELEDLESRIPHEGQVRSIASAEAFSDEQQNREKNIEFDFMVSKNRLKRLEDEYQIAKRQLENLSKNKITKEASVSKLRADLDFLKNLESKQLSLKLMSSTMTSDLFFEEFSKASREFRRSSIGKIFLFSFFFVSFLYSFSILIRYFIDDRIYTEDDLKHHFDKLDFIGEVPSFE